MTALSITNPEITNPEIKLSVYTIGHHSAGECLFVVRELQRQTIRENIEVLVVAPNRDGLDEKEFESFGAWRWVIVPQIETCGQAMAAGVDASRAPYVTYAEEHSFFGENWAEKLIEAHERGYSVVGFAMENANPETITSWAHLYGQFGPVVAPVESGETTFLGGHHVSYSKELLESYGDLMQAMLEDESALFLDLRGRGIPLYIAGEAISIHANVSDLKSYMRLDYFGQRSFASARAQVGQWSWLERVLYAGATPLIPWVRLRRILYHIKRTGRQKEMLPRILWPLAGALSAGAWGEMLGYLVGGGRSAQGKTPVELQRENYMAANDNWKKSKYLDSAT